MDQATAATVVPGARVTFEGTPVFHAGKYGVIGRTIEVQQMHTINHNVFPSIPLGTYTSADCKITVGGKVYPSRWAP